MQCVACSRLSWISSRRTASTSSLPPWVASLHPSMVVVSGADRQGASIPIRGCICTVSRTRSPAIGLCSSIGSVKVKRLPRPSALSSRSGRRAARRGASRARARGPCPHAVRVPITGGPDKGAGSNAPVARAMTRVRHGRQARQCVVRVDEWDGALMEPSGRNPWQPVANGGMRKRLKQAKTVAVGCDRLRW